MMARHRIVLGGLLAGIVFFNSTLPETNAATRDFLTVALTGSPAAGSSPGETFNTLNAPTINNAGQVAFKGTLAGGTIDSTNDAGIWAGGTNALSLVAREGQHAPGTSPGIVFNFFNNPALNDAGHIAVKGTFSGPGVNVNNNDAIWSDLGFGLNMIVREQQQAPGTEPGTNFITIGGPNLTTTGRTTIFGQLVDGTVNAIDNAGMWSTRDGDLSLIMRQGQQAPGLAPGVIFKSLQSATVNDFGFVGIRPILEGPGIDSTNDQGIWVEKNGALDLVVRKGDSVPTQPGSEFTIVFPQAMNNSGQIAFRARTNGASSDGIFSNSNGSIDPVAMAGQTAPGIGADFTFFTNPVLNEDGDSAFAAQVVGGSGLFSGSGDGLHLVAQTGAPAPGVDDGAVFGNFTQPTFPANYVLNGNGDVAFLSPLLNTANSQGIFAEISGILSLIVQKGDQIEVAPGDFRTVSFLSFDGVSGNQDAASSAFNDLGQIAFKADFTDGTDGIFIVNTIPEPATSLMALSGALPLLRTRRRVRADSNLG
ncbi:MAG: hypothetical protein H6818_05365 [Phycisphaerales bacterium]|nr:hypothetical protein [Phycisphaerales bacterium]MCB9863386.1 hypothetical protein [Phycisphaerales bacterium]